MTIWAAEIKEIERLYDSIKGHSPELEKELERLISSSDENMVLVYARRCLEVIITDLCEYELKRPRKTEPLQGIIDKLNREEKIPSHIFVSMQSLNSLSTFGSHPKDFDPEQVKPVLNNLSTIIKWYRKYKDTQIISKAKTAETKPDIEKPVDIKELSRKPNKKIILLLSGLLLVVAIVIMFLFAFNIIGGKKRSQELIHTEKTIAVLPFINMSDDPEQEYFSDGITEDILNHLSKIADLSVKSRTSTLQYKGSTKPIPEIGDELSVDAILEGSVRKAGNTVRIVAQLIDAKTDIHIWSETYDREITDIFSIQSEIAIKIANALQVKLTESERGNINTEASTDITAYDYYLKARQIFYDWNGDEKKVLENILQLLEQAIDLDPDFALGYYGIGVILHYGMRWYGVPTEIWIDSALALSGKAIELDPSLPEGYILRSAIYQNYPGRQNESKNDLQMAYKLAPSNSDVLFSLGDIYLNEGNYKLGASMIVKGVMLGYNKKDPRYYINWGDLYLRIDEYDKAEMLYMQAIKLDPGSLLSYYYLGYLYFNSLGKYTEAIEIYEDVLAISPMDRRPIDALGWSYLFLGNLDKAEEYWSKYKEIEHQFSDTSQYVPFRHRLAYVKWLKGEKEKAMSLFQEQMKLDKETQKGLRGYGVWNARVYYYDLGIVNAFLGNREEAYMWLDSAANYGWFELWTAEHDSLLNGIRHEERFQAIIRKKREEADMEKNAFKEVMSEPEVKKQIKWFFDK